MVADAAAAPIRVRAIKLRLFVAGVTGVIGARLLPQLVAAGHQVTGMTGSAGKAGRLELLGVNHAVVDAFDGPGLAAAVERAVPDVVIHQLTDLSGGFAPTVAVQTMRRNAKLRQEGTRNLVAAARSAGVRRVVAQTRRFVWCWAPYRPWWSSARRSAKIPA